MVIVIWLLLNPADDVGIKLNQCYFSAVVVMMIFGVISIYICE